MTEPLRFAIDLTWVRHNKVGGTESSVRNMLDGLAECGQQEAQIVLLLTRDTAQSFAQYSQYPQFTVHVCPVNAASQRERVLWQNFCMGRMLCKMGIDRCLEPVYGKPLLGTQGIRFYTIIHDLQAKHYPQYFSFGRNLWMRISWWNAVYTSYRVIAISEYVKEDILRQYHVSPKKISVVYDAVALDMQDIAPLGSLADFGVQAGEYYYTVSSLLPHKNLTVLLEMLHELKESCAEAFRPLVISGIGGKARSELEARIHTLELDADVHLTPFVSNAQRNLLYKNCKAFLFPSVFEGFGMPPVEAMMLGVPVVTTHMTSLPEVTGGLVNYVEDATDAQSWCRVLQTELKVPTAEKVQELTRRYQKEKIGRQILDMISAK